MMKKMLEKILAIFTRMILKKYKPTVVAITGSVGKTSAKDACFEVLNTRFRTRKNVKNYNNEIGVPLTVIGAEAGGKSIAKWIGVFVKAKKLILFTDKNYPEVLVLEFGADRPGDIKYLTELVPVTIGIVTKVAPAHTEYFGSVDGVAREKRHIVSALSKDGFAILNADDERVMKMQKSTKANVMTFGLEKDADVQAVFLENKSDPANGLRFKIAYEGSTVPVHLPEIIGNFQASAALAAAAAGLALGMNLVDISAGLNKYHPPKGRMRVLEGKNDSIIIDDTYNSSPAAAQAAVKAVAELPQSTKIAVMGDMLELGELSEKEHHELGKSIAKHGFAQLLAVGLQASDTAKGARAAGLKNVKTFKTAAEAADFMLNDLPESAVILVKGSQGSRMERVAKAMLADESKAKDLLVRQSAKWLKTP